MPTRPAAENNYLSFNVGLDTGVASRGIWLCIAQLPARSKQEIEGDSSCAGNVEILSEVLQTTPDQQPLLKLHAQPDQLPLLLCPEYAFGSDDWAKIDTLVDEFPGQLLLVAGFGQCSLAGLQSITATALTRQVELRRGWHEEPSPGGRAMNFGCVWVKRPDQSREAILFGKNFLEAKLEDINGVFQFKQLTEIVFNDLRLFPFICADALETPVQGGGPTVPQRLSERVLAQHQPALCVGSLMQPSRQASDTWTNAINRLIQEFGESEVALAISNVASAKYDVRAGGSQWRNLSGVYVSKRKQKNSQKRGQEPTGYFETSYLMAWPLRSTHPQLAFGAVYLPPYATDSNKLHPWNALPNSRRDISCNDRPRIRDYSRSGIQDELLLLAEVTYCVIGAQPLEFQHVSRFVREQTNDAAIALISRLLEGPLWSSAKRWSAGDLCEKCTVSLAICLSCLDALLEGATKTASVDEKFIWAPATASSGEVLRLGTQPIPVAMWFAFNSTTEEMLVELRRRAAAHTGTVLRVFGRGCDGDVDPDLWKNICIDTTAPTGAPVAHDEIGDEYADLRTDAAVPIEHLIKPSGFQPLMRLVKTRCENSSTEFARAYGALVRSMQS